MTRATRKEEYSEHGMLALLGKPGVIDDPQARAHLRTQHSGHLLAHRLEGPRTLANKMLQRLDISVRQPLGHRLNRLPLALQQQPADVDLRPRMPILAPQIRKYGSHVIDEALAKMGVGERRRRIHRRHPLRRRLLRTEMRCMRRSLQSFRMTAQNPVTDVTL